MISRPMAAGDAARASVAVVTTSPSAGHLWRLFRAPVRRGVDAAERCLATRAETAAGCRATNCAVARFRIRRSPEWARARGVFSTDGDEWMGARKSVVALSLLIAGGLAVSGCATKKFVRQEVGVVSTRVDTVATHVDTVEGTAKDALERATAAGKLAEGKFLYQLVLQDDSVKFPLNKYELSPEAQARLTEFAEKLKSENKNVYVEIQGHTDATGDTAYNEELGSERAEAVRRFLNHEGVALNRMATISYGEESPVQPNDTREGRAANRRVVLVVMS
jgi:outer membrane protein OmpA-like peptidoglycan-associated protein